MGKVIARNVVSRKKGYLYYIDAKGNVCEAKMARGGRRRKSSSKSSRKSSRRKKR